MLGNGRTKATFGLMMIDSVVVVVVAVIVVVIVPVGWWVGPLWFQTAV